jgi:exodeoxyribonuclease V
MTQLSAQQLAGIEKIHNWYANVYDADGQMASFSANVFRLFGYAGTGKTTMAKEIPEALGLEGRVRYGTFTGKAAHVLRQKGAEPVSTIHSGIYMPTTSAEARAELEAARAELEELEDVARQLAALKHDEARGALVVGLGWASVMEFAGHLDETRERIPELEAATKRLSWEWNPDSEWARAGLIILDEVSMVSAKLAADVEAYGVPILVLGDPAQLPPVEGGGYYTNAQPDHLLTEIHRFAAENPITALATRIRESQGAGLGLVPDDMTPRSVRHAMEHDQILCWKNKTRWSLIQAIRTLKGLPEGLPVAGDRIMVLSNNRDMAVFNGQQMDVLDSRPGALGPTLTLKTEEGHEVTMPVFSDGFLGQEMQEQAKKSGAGIRGNRALATFADAITVHKAQGSEWNSVYVVNETPPMMSMTARSKGQNEAIAQARQWLYTSVTRAQERVTITAPRAN